MLDLRARDVTGEAAAREIELDHRDYRIVKGHDPSEPMIHWRNVPLFVGLVALLGLLVSWRGH